MKTRPSAWWFAVGAGLLVAAVDVDCAVTDPRTGADVAQSPTLASWSKTTGSTSWVGLQTFSGASGAVLVVCDSSYGPVQVGPAPSVARFGGGLAVAVLALVLLGLLGLAVLVVTGVLFVSRPPRRHPAGPPPSAGPAR